MNRHGDHALASDAGRRRPFRRVSSLVAVAALIVGLVIPVSLSIGVSAASADPQPCGSGAFPTLVSNGNCPPSSVNFLEQGSFDLSGIPICGIEGSFAPLAVKAVDQNLDDINRFGPTTEGNYTDSEAFQFQPAPNTQLQPGDVITVSLPRPSEPYSPSGSILPPAQVGTGGTSVLATVTATPPNGTTALVTVSGVGTGEMVRLDAFSPYNPPTLNHAPGANVSGSNTSAGIQGFDSTTNMYDSGSTTTVDSSGLAKFQVTDASNEVVVLAATVTTFGLGISQTATLSFGSPTAPSNPECPSAQLAAPPSAPGEGFTYILIVNGIGYLVPSVSVSSASGVETASATIPPGVPPTTGQVTLDVLDALSPPGQGTPSNQEPQPNLPYPPDAFSVSTTQNPVPGFPGTAPRFEADASATILAVSANASTLTLSNPTAQVGTGVINATATLHDQYNNAVNAKQVSVFAASGSHANVAPQTPPIGTAYPQTGFDGTVTYNVTDSCAETFNLEATDVDDHVVVVGPAGTPGTPVTFIAGPAVAPDATTVPTTCGTTPAKSSIAVNNVVSGPGVQTNVPADGLTTARVTVTLADQFGNVDACQQVVLRSTSSHASITPLAPANPVSNASMCPNANHAGYTGSDGVAQFDVSDATAEQVVFSVTDTTVISVWPTSPTSNPQDVGVVLFEGGDAGKSTLTPIAQNAPGDGQPSAVLTATINDAAGQPLRGKSVTVSSCTSDPTPPGSCTSDPTSTITALGSKTDSNGQVQFEVSDNSTTLPHTVFYQATDVSDGITVTTPAQITFTIGGASLSASPTTVIADGIGTSTVTFTLKDTNNQPLPTTVPVSVTLTASDGNAVISPSGATPTDGAGSARFTISDTQPGSVTFTATATYSSTAAPCLGIVTNSTCTVKALVAVTFLPAPHSFSVVAAPSANIPADGFSTSLVTVTALDSHGNPIGGIPVVLGTTGTAQVTALSNGGVTSGNGLATFIVTDNKAETVTVNAQYHELGAGGATESAPGCAATPCTATVTFVASEAQASTVIANPSSAPADGHSTVTVVVTLMNGSGGALNGHAVVLTTGSTTTTVTPSNVGGDTGVAPLPAGQVSFTVIDTRPESLAVYARDENTGAILDAMPTITFQPTEIQLSSAAANPTTLAAGGPPGSPRTSTVTVTLVAPICGGPSLAGHTIRLTTPSGSAVIAPPAVTNSAGMATFTVADPVVESVVLTAVDTTCGVTLAQTATVAFTTAESNQSTVSINPTSTPAQGVPATLTVTLRSAAGAPIGGHTVTVPTAGHATVSALASPGLAPGVTNAQGTVQFAVSDNTVETVTLAAFDGTTELDQAATVSFTANEANQSTISATQTSVPAGSPNGTAVTVTLVNGAGVPIAGDVVSLSASSPTAAISPASVATNSSGQATFTVTDPTVETVVLSALDRTTGVTVVAVATVTFAANEQNQSTITPPNQAVKVRKSATITVTLRSATGAPIANHAVTLATGSKTAMVTVLTAGGKTNAAGQIQFSVTDTVAENLSIRATDTTASPPVTLYQAVAVIVTKA